MNELLVNLFDVLNIKSIYHIERIKIKKPWCRKAKLEIKGLLNLRVIISIALYVSSVKVGFARKRAKKRNKNRDVVGGPFPIFPSRWF